ncbi:proline-rich protein HaeIII subfamily 1-like [Rhinopithecus roxellana]|uniref:proline-rich protein HaeIII subfamily 1-like n=1 Tax=Rhinopithecus roxellana TaxID=61622 RepID=UPI0012376973|nr:proline-rich protein HaeIII subfamily 1-like [Rhinopithecus roxellana]
MDFPGPERPHAQLIGHGERPFQATSLPLGGFPRPRTSSGRPLQAQLQPPGLLTRPSSSCSTQRPQAHLPPKGPLGPSLCLTADSPRPALASLRPPQASAPPAFPQLRQPRFCLPVASLGPAHSSRGRAFPGPVLGFWCLSRPRSSSGRPLQAQLRPPGLLSRPNSSSSRPPLGQLLSLGGLSSCQTFSGQPLQVQLLLPATGLFRPSPAHASGRPSQAPLLTSGGLLGPRT